MDKIKIGHTDKLFSPAADTKQFLFVFSAASSSSSENDDIWVVVERRKNNVKIERVLTLITDEKQDDSVVVVRLKCIFWDQNKTSVKFLYNVQFHHLQLN